MSEEQKMRLQRRALLDLLPPEWPEELLPVIRRVVKDSGTKIVALDDDPTGTQTVYNVPVLTEWSVPLLESVLAEQSELVYILTNSRSVTLDQAQAMNLEIAANLLTASRTTKRSFVVVSRSDSTLRGHYPGEVDALAEGLGKKFDGTLIVPFFHEGGRLTIHDTHYVVEGDWLLAVAETEYARDVTFGYRNSDLRAWVSEKHCARIAPQDVASVSLATLRMGGPEAVTAKLNQVRGGKVCVVNAVTYRDLEVFVAGLLRAEAAGQRFLYRTAASFVRVRAGLIPQNLLTPTDLATFTSKTGGLIIVGSFVKMSTAQMEAASQLPGVVSFELAVEKVLDDEGRDCEIGRLAGLVDLALASGRDVLLYSTRQLVTGPDPKSPLQVGQIVSSALVAVVEHVSERPAWLIAKGGITSSDVATKGLQVRRAEVLGQALAGVPIWRTGQESRWPGMIYVVFPGNVGGPGSLAEMIRILRREDPGQLQAQR